MDDSSLGVRDAFERGDYEAAATLTLHGYGPELMRFLVERLRDENEAREVFSQFVEDFWRGLPRFEWRCSMRAWAYTLARHAANRHARAPRRRPECNLPLTLAEGVPEVIERSRTATHLHLRSEVKERVRKLREALPCDDQLLVTLRIDKGMTWPEIAFVLEETEPGADPGALALAAARVRQRFQTVKARLRRLARREGLLDRDG